MMGGLCFLSPLFLLGALAVAVPILLHLFRRRTEPVVDFPAVRLLAAAPVEQQRRRRLRDLLLLALRVAALVLLAGAFARPYLASTTLAADAAVTIVAVDTSFSLSAAAAFARAKELAIEAVRDAPASQAVALMAFGDAATTVRTPTTDRGAVIAAIGSMTPGASVRATARPSRGRRSCWAAARDAWSSSRICSRPGGKAAPARVCRTTLT